MTIMDGLQPAPDDHSGPSFPQRVDYPTSYIQLSDLRTSTKRKRASTSASSTTSLSTPPTLPSDQEAGIHVAQALDGYFLVSGGVTLHGPPQNLCADCVVDCDDADCPEEKCTDRCIVVPCNNQDNCRQVCTEETCRIENCDGGERCFGMFDEPFQLLCCTDYHGNNANTSQMNWNSSLDDILGANGCNYGLPGSSHFPASSSHIPNISLNSMSVLHDMQINASSFGEVTQDCNVLTSSENAVAAPSEPQKPETRVSEATSQSMSDQEFVCRWSGCTVSFNSLNELVGHVNLAHLRLPSASPQSSKRPRLDSDSDSPDNAATDNQELFPFSCHWDDCHLYPNSSAFPGPSTGLQPEMAFDLLSSHFFHDHLGLSVPPSQVPSLFQSVAPASSEAQHAENSTRSQIQSNSNGLTTAAPGTTPPVAEVQSKRPSNENVQTMTTVPDEPSYVTPAPSPSPDNTIVPATVNPHDCSQSQHICHWASCGKSFSTCADLTAHLAEAHVGSGKGHYDCHWGDCTRNGSHGFASKQKIMRHLQAHTGHRPFTCKECGQHFSEAATLAQHMRRHTQEKPFVCDFPGCGKAFAITGALTIHKRTHNGERPFQCPHCDRAFAESSNLSKHLRTHTGDRPYRCTEPGCGKAFARPDQLQRHRSVHTKNRTNGSAFSPNAVAVPPVDQTKSGERIVVK